MKLTQKLTQRLDTKLKLTQDLHRAIGFLELSNLELAQTLREAASDNPWLRLRLPTTMDQVSEEISDPGPSLRSHVLSQIDRLVPHPADRPIAHTLLDALGPNGILDTHLDAIASTLQLPSSRVEVVLSSLQKIEPRGLFARSLGECLALQLAEEGELSPQMRRVLDALPILAERGPEALAEAAGICAADLSSLLAKLRDLNPRPAQGFSTDIARTRIADLLFEKEGDTWGVRLNPESLPQVSLADYSQGETLGTSLSQERSAAKRLVNAIEKRNESLLALGNLLAREQARFLSEGPSGQRILTRREAARQLSLHESTVGRLVGSSSAATPSMGILSLKVFFCRAVRRNFEASNIHGPPAIIARIEKMIAAEDSIRPLNDGQISEALSSEGISVSRRVVARLRTRAGIPNRAERRSRLD